MKTRITELLGIEYPIIQGGMAWVATHELASAVSNAGGLGIIGAGGAPATWVRDQIRACKQETDTFLKMIPPGRKIVRPFHLMILHRRLLLPEETDKYPVRFQQEILFSADDIKRRQPSAVFLKLPEKIARIIDAGSDLLRIAESLPVIVIVRHRVLVLGRHILHVVRQDRGRHGKGPFEFLRIVICCTDCAESAH